MLRTYADLTKFGIVVFSVISGVIGYATGFQIEEPFRLQEFIYTIIGMYFLSSGSLALNQVQEYKLDQKMPRTAKRPVASGKIKPAAALILSLSYLAVGLYILFDLEPMAGWVSLVCVFLYNGPYTMWWKPKWVFGAIPGAIPGSLPVTIGYAVANPEIWNPESLYLFLIMFMWQMPHFWILAIKFKDDYAKGGIPTLPVALGLHRTMLHVGIWTFVYVGTALAAPIFVHVSWVFLLLTIPLCFKVMQEFIRYYKSNGTERWLAFFMWLNVSMLVFIAIPVIDKWNFLFIHSN